MTLSTLINKNKHTGNGVAVTYAYAFRILDEDHIDVYVNDVLQTLTTDYTVTGEGDAGGGDIVFIVAPPDTQPVILIRSVPLNQQADYNDLDGFPAETNETALDKGVMLNQDNEEKIDRSIKQSLHDTDLDSHNLPAYESSKGLKWDSGTKKLVNTTTDPDAFASAEAAAEAVLAAEFPDPAVANNFLQRNLGNTAYESKTAQAVADILNPLLTGRINKAINGAMMVSQRGIAFVAGANNDGDYTLDRWYILSDGNDVIDVTQETSVIPTNGLYALAMDVETINKKFGVGQIIEQENIIGLVGNTVTLSFEAMVSSIAKLDNVKCAIISWDGTADAPTHDFISAWGAEDTDPTLVANYTYENVPVNLNLTTDYVKYSVTAAIDTASTKNIALFVWSDVTDTTLGDFLRVTNVQIEESSVATPFEQRSIGEEEALCKRYVRELIDQNSGIAYIASGQVDSTTTAIIPLVYDGMRGIPTITLSAASTFGVTNIAGSTLGCTVITPSAISQVSALLTATVASGLVAGSGTLLRGDATPPSILVDSEL